MEQEFPLGSVDNLCPKGYQFAWKRYLIPNNFDQRMSFERDIDFLNLYQLIRNEGYYFFKYPENLNIHKSLKITKQGFIIFDGLVLCIRKINIISDNKPKNKTIWQRFKSWIE